MKEKFKKAFMKVAHTFAELSSARKLKVGAIVVKDDRIISIGYNGTVSGSDNCCESVEYGECSEQFPLSDSNGNYRLVTHPHVIHAEMNALLKLARSHESGDGAFLFITHSPCLECAKHIKQVGISQVYYENEYRSPDGIQFLNSNGVLCTRVSSN